MDLHELHRQMLDPASYPEPTRQVEYRETHISRVYLTDQYAYKLKKPLDLGFLDFSTLERRGFFCAEEVRLNRRFAPAVYLGVVALRDNRGRLRFDGHGLLLDYAVRMRRLPDVRMLDHMIEAADPALPGEIERLAGHLAPLLAACSPCREAAPGDHLTVLRGNCAENLAQTETAIGHTLTDAAHRLMSTMTWAALARLAPLCAEREARGLVRDGHGDLHARNICMTDPIAVYDCIEFSHRLRVADVAAELAFLLMDLDFRNRRDLSVRFLTAYLNLASETLPPELLRFYQSYRAWVRGKVDFLLAGEGDVDTATRRSALERSRRYFNLALGYHLPPMLLLTSGLMGVGKTAIARALASATGAAVLRSDVVRKELAGLAPAQSRPEAYASGLYAPAMNERTYGELWRRARALLGNRRLVIVDASFARESDRQSFFALAEQLGIPAYLLHLRCPMDTVVRRLDRRQAEGLDASDGRRELLPVQSAFFEPPAPGPQLIEIDSSAAIDYNVQQLLCRLLPG